ncbi:heterokaryon incompatibility protein-domain-containing protein [Xylaria bambusicola]|uniref:heterokaryon incompatibility protein-domain-containing protein n=1 Tax=Xylaria bambusicola TaxID=326684 RepID=UPI0020085E77|nr:heterokaryon incompatibility protein-domain-containing protein [Xylaria bambusicola]KAI0516721.1 heterokaryon incompatibility protein-domain-containing protein [Xylaria bambusicola]
MMDGETTPAAKNYWHGSECSGPMIEFEEHGLNCEIKDTCHLSSQCRLVPICVACGRKPPLHDIISENKSSSNIAIQPRDKPFGELNLHWPSESLYHNSTSFPTPEKFTYPQTLSHVYPTILRPDQFRQACLSPTDGENFRRAPSTAAEPEEFPVHLTLETYEQDNCPEYEAFSYTWEGEHLDRDNETDLGYPIYIGPSWDVLIQTKNCCDLLRFARLPDVTRRVWVDAICINQGNMEERAQQVAKMGRIYRESLRVVVYLGPDVAMKPKHRFPRRHPLDEFASGEVRPMDSNGLIMDLNLEKLFKRRYFTRLWVIQELITSSKTIIRIGDTDFLVDSIITERLKKTEEWSSAMTSAPWFQYVARQTFGENPCDALALVSNSNCSDSRDRLFGILSLISRRKTASQGLQANYSISSQHLWIGFFAHCLLRLEILWFLEYAVGSHRSPRDQELEAWIPSWMPDWTSPLTWQRFKYTRRFYSDVASETLYSLLKVDPNRDFRRFRQDFLTLTRLAPVYGGESRMYWNQGITVDSETGTLKDIRAIHLLRIPSIPRLQTRFGVYEVYEIDLHSVNWHTKQEDKDLRNHQQCLYIVSTKPLVKEVLPLHDHLYALHPENINGSLEFLILRDTKGPLPFSKPRVRPGYFEIADHETFTLVATVPYAYFGFDPEMCKAFKIQMTIPAVAELSLDQLPRLLTVRQLIDDIRTFLNQKVDYDFDLYPSNKGKISRELESLNEYFFREGLDVKHHEKTRPLDWNQIFPRSRNSDLLPVYWELANQILNPKALSDEKLATSCIRSVHPDFQPVIRNGYVEYSFGPRDYGRFGIMYCNIRAFVMYKNVKTGVYQPEWEWSRKHLAWTKFSKRSPGVVLWPWHEETFYIRAPLSHVLSAIRCGVQTCGMARCVAWLRDIFKTDDLEELRERLAQPRDELDNLKVEKRDFAIDGDVRIINIR